MSVAGYLVRQAARAILSDAEKLSISRSLAHLRTNLNLYLGYPTTSLVLFGSYWRGTNLPRAMDPRSDVDFMVAFKDGGFRPQTYLDRLKRFVEARYSRTEVYQSAPTVVLELNHIRFELVPAIATHGRDFIIPNGPDQWQHTSPFDFQQYFQMRNTAERSMLKPAIRLLKFWNAQNGYPYASYELEQWAVANSYFGCQNVRDYLFAMIDDLPWQHGTQWRAGKVERAKAIVSTVRSYLRYYEFTAEQEVKKLIPE